MNVEETLNCLHEMTFEMGVIKISRDEVKGKVKDRKKNNYE